MVKKLKHIGWKIVTKKKYAQIINWEIKIVDSGLSPSIQIDPFTYICVVP
jgi:hypothetical protein